MQMADKKKEEEKMLLYAEYLVEAIDGDYAHLIRTDNPGNAEQEDSAKLVARALLPPETGEGTRLVYEMMQYRLQE